MAKLWSGLQPIHELNQGFQKHDLTTNNVADVMAGTLVGAWQEIHQAPDPSDAAVTATRDQFRKALLSGHSFAKYTDKQKQEAVEELEYVDILYAFATKIGSTASDPAAQAALREHFADNFQRYLKLDLRKLQLTPSGFVL